MNVAKRKYIQPEVMSISYTPRDTLASISEKPACFGNFMPVLYMCRTAGYCDRTEIGRGTKLALYSA